MITGSSSEFSAASPVPKLSPVQKLKLQAKALRAELAADNNPVSHGRSLELLAQRLDYRDWNGLRAASLRQAIANPGDNAPRGRYLGQAFTAEVLKAEALGRDNLFRITFHFDEAVDVVTHPSFSSFRHRITGNIDARGQTMEKTSDGQPQIMLELVGA